MLYAQILKRYLEEDGIVKKQARVVRDVRCPGCGVLMRNIGILLLCSCLLFGCEWIRWTHAGDIFKHPGVWREIRPKIEYGMYYFLRDEYEALQQHPTFEVLPCADFWGA